jgi:hypothetical protein
LVPTQQYTDPGKNMAKPQTECGSKQKVPTTYALISRNAYVYTDEARNNALTLAHLECSVSVHNFQQY